MGVHPWTPLPTPTAQSPDTWYAPEVRTNNEHLCKETDRPLFMSFCTFSSIRLLLYLGHGRKNVFLIDLGKITP